MNNIYLLQAGSDSIDFDCYEGHVIVAPTSKIARSLAPYGDEGFLFRKESKYATIKKIGTSEIKQQVLLSSFRAG